jgi:hypothetical protein
MPGGGTLLIKPKHPNMSASNETPRNPKVLLGLAQDFADGMTQLQGVIGLHHHRDTTLRPAIAKLEGDPAAPVGSNANKGSQLVYKDCVDATGDAVSAMKALSDGAVKTFLAGYRKVMEGIHGRTFNAGWAAAGFTNNSTAVPAGHDGRFALLMAARSYLVAHPNYEASLPQPNGPALAITAAAALALHTQFSDARQLINSRQGEQENCKLMRDADVEALYDEVSGGIAEVRDLLTADDPRWETLGLNIPANPNPPEPVASLTLTAAGTGRELAEWPHARRATYYRVFIQVQGVDADFRFVDRTEDLDFILKDLTPGATIAVHIVAANEGGEAPPSPAVTKVVGA